MRCRIHSLYSKGRQDKGEEGKEVFGSGRQERQDEGGNEIVRRRQDDGQDERGKVFRWQDDDDNRQMEKLTDAVRRQLEDDRRQDVDVMGWEDDRRQDEDDMGWAIDVGKKENERSRELGRVNLDDFFRRYEWEHRKSGSNNKAEIVMRGSHSVVVGRGILRIEGKMVVVNKMKEKD